MAPGAPTREPSAAARHAGPARQREPARARPVCRWRDVEMLLPVDDRQLHRLLLLARTRHQRRHHAARAAERADAELAAPARRVSWPGQLASSSAAPTSAGRTGRRKPTMPPRRRSARADRSISSWNSACLIGPGNALGQPIPTAQAPEHVFGMVLVNDWSARDIQKWEYQPLGPFLAKNFATSISPWVVTLDALEPFRVAGPKQDPEPLPYLRCHGDWAYDIHLEVWLQTRADGRTRSASARRTPSISTGTSASRSPITPSTAATCNPATCSPPGTISGPTPDSLGSMLELAWKGTRPIAVAERRNARRSCKTATA